MPQYVTTRTFTTFFRGESHEAQAHEEIIAHVMNREGMGKSQAIGIIFDTGFKKWSKEAGEEVQELWGLAKLEVAARKALSRQKRISEAAQIVGEDAILEEAMRMGMDEEKAKSLIEKSVDASGGSSGISKSMKMRDWLRDFLGNNGSTTVADVKNAAVIAGIISDNIFEKERDWSLMETTATRCSCRGEERGMWGLK